MHKLFCIIIKNLIKIHCNVLRQRDKVPNPRAIRIAFAFAIYRQHIVPFVIGTEAVFSSFNVTLSTQNLYFHSNKILLLRPTTVFI